MQLDNFFYIRKSQSVSFDGVNIAHFCPVKFVKNLLLGLFTHSDTAIFDIHHHLIVRIPYKNINFWGSFENLKQAWQYRDNKWDSGLVIFLSESKHKIKKKAEQAACKLAIETLK